MGLCKVQETTRVEVSLAKDADNARKKKSCWFPFKKQIKNRKSLTLTTTGPEREPSTPGPNIGANANDWDIDGLEKELSRNSKKNIQNIQHIQQHNNRDYDGEIIPSIQPQEFRNRITKKNEGSVSTSTGTRTDTSTSLLSEESESTVVTGSYTSPSRSKAKSGFHRGGINTSGVQYKHNPNIGIGIGIGNEKSFMEEYYNRNKDDGKINGTACHNEDLDDDDASIVVKAGGGNSKRNAQSAEQCLGDIIPRDVVKQVVLDTKKCWADDVVEGGAFNCLQERDIEQNRGRSRVRRNRSGKSGAKGSTTTTNQPGVHPLVRMMRFVSEDPEGANDGAPLRRALCSAIPLRDRNPVTICRNRGETCLQDAQNPTTNQQWTDKMNSVGKLHPRRSFSEEEQPNFYVEVEAMGDQLDAVRDLEEIQAENDEFEEEVAEARTNSLADEDSAFRESSQGGSERDALSRHSLEISPTQSEYAESISSTSKRLVQNIMSGTKSNGTKTYDRRNLVASFEQRNSSKVQTAHSRGPSHQSQQQQTDRRGKLISEMVTDRVLAMKMENVAIGNSLPRDTEEFMVTKTEHKLRGESLKAGARSHERQAGTPNRQLPNDSISNHLPPIILDPLAPASSFNPLNISELTDSSFHHLEPIDRDDILSDERKKYSPHQNSNLSIMQSETFDEEKEQLQEPEIGYSTTVHSASLRDSNATFSPRRGHQSMHADDLYDGTKPQWEAGPSYSEFSPIDTNRAQSDVNTNFSETFWKGDTDDLNTEVFELYGSENESVFDDLSSYRSGYDGFSKFTKGESQPSRAYSNDNSGKYGTHGFNEIPYSHAKPSMGQTEFPRLSIAVKDSPKYKRRISGNSISRVDYLKRVDY